MFLKIIRSYSQRPKAFYVSTPIYYINDVPHIGHLYSSVLADATCRWHALKHKNNAVKLVTGTDEHGIKIQKAAVKVNTELGSYCDYYSGKFRNMADTFSVAYTDFVRTTDERHSNAVTNFWRTINQNGHIYHSKYSGWYCTSDETFLTESQLKTEKTGLVSAESGHPVDWVEEENYMFRLSSFQEEVKYWLHNNENAIKPKKFQKILLHLLFDEQLPDISISRPISRMHWGIQVPEDPNQTIYVWLDALVNYLTAAGYPQTSSEQFKSLWPPDVHVIGKDILKFHGVYWPAFLLAANLELPKSILCHSHWTVNDEKMSKSKGNVVCPMTRSEVYTSEGLRYFLLREGVAHSDGNYNDVKVVRILNSELADTLGNLLSRCTGTALNKSQQFPEVDKLAFSKIAELEVTKKLFESLSALPEICSAAYDNHDFYKGIEAVILMLHKANLFFETTKPWALKKNPEQTFELNCVLHIAMDALRTAGILLQPIVPAISKKLLDKLLVPTDQRFYSDTLNPSWNSTSFKSRELLNENVVLFKRILSERRKEQCNVRS